MMKIQLLVFLLASVSLLSFNSVEEKTTNLTVKIGNIRSAEGQVYIFLYNYENQYPKHPHSFYKVSKSKLTGGKLKYTIPGLPHGKYAITLVDDENMNDDLDRTWGIPTEGYGFSNNQAVTSFRLPKYRNLLFPVDGENNDVFLSMAYLF